MKAALGFACKRPLHREHLRTASLVMLVQALIGTAALSDTTKGLILTVALFAWDIVFIMADISIDREVSENDRSDTGPDPLGTPRPNR